jgi:sugar phosphate isomerase/epimerase
MDTAKQPGGGRQTRVWGPAPADTNPIMNLAFNTYVYEVAKWPIEKTLRSAKRLGFRYTEYAACGSGDPTLMSAKKRREVVKLHRELGLYSSQLLLANVEHMACPSAKTRQQVLDYMKRCSEFQLELGGRQVLVCWGCGVHLAEMLPEQAWLNSINSIRSLAQWGLRDGLLVDLEIEPHVFFILNSTDKAARMVEDIGLPNVFPNLDIGHFTINREAPHRIEKIKDKIIHIHLSETQGYEHTNSIIGTGTVDFASYVRKAVELGVEENCKRVNQPCIAGIEMGEPHYPVDNPDRWMTESLQYLAKHLPELTR